MMSAENKEPETKKEEKPAFLKTLSLSEFSEAVGLPTKAILERVSRGEIIAIQTGGKGKEISYRFLESEVNRYTAWVQEQLRLARLAEQEKESEKKGLKQIEIYERKGNENAEFIMAIRWTPDFAKVTVASLIAMISKHLKKDYSRLRNAFITSGGTQLVLKDRLGVLLFNPYESERKDKSGTDLYFIAEILFEFPVPAQCPTETTAQLPSPGDSDW